MQIVKTIYIIIKLVYPSNDIDSIRFYNKCLDDAMKNYCFIGIEYDLAIDDTSRIDLYVLPETLFFIDKTILGVTYGGFLYNPRVYGVPNIKTAAIGDNNWGVNYNVTQVLTHELGHYFGLSHSLDTMSVMYPYLRSNNLKLTRDDSLRLKSYYEKQ